jgi:LPS sulfotransferase NodH
MIHHGIGFPHEYFNPQHISLIAKRCGIPALADGQRLGSDSEARRSYLQAILQRRTVNGTFAAKVHWGQYASYLNNPEGVDLLQSAHFIHLYREDLLAQAISFFIAKITGRWGTDDSVATPPGGRANFFDVEAIEKEMNILAVSDANWRLFFSRNGIKPLRLSYEQLTRNVGAVLRNIVDCFALDASAGDLSYFEEGPMEARDEGVPGRSEIRARFLTTKRQITPASSAVAQKAFRSDAEASAVATPSGEQAGQHEPHKDELVAGLSRKLDPDYSGDDRKKIGLCMIVKNEAHVITRCLDSVRPMIDYVLIEDTGSSDGTQEIIRDWLKRNDVSGQVIEEPWQNFAHNRTHVMKALRKVESVDYALIIDADDRLALDPGFDPPTFKQGMQHDLYDVQIRQGGSRWMRPHICNNRMVFCYKAVVHEFLEGPQTEFSRTTAEGFHIEIVGGGGRHKNPRKYQDDVAALEQALTTETDPHLIARYTFYMAQSYRDCGENVKALANYLKRAEQGFWPEEIFYSLYQAGKIKESLRFAPEEVIATYLRATDVSPSRAEALHAAARYCRSIGRNEEGFQYAKRAADKPIPPAGLFTESSVYDYGVLDEVGINGYWSGHYLEAVDACAKLLGSPGLPAHERERIARNAQLSLAKLPRDPNPARFRPKGLAPGQYALQPPRALHSALPEKPPKILLAILAKQKETVLPLYLSCIEALDYPKSSIVVYIRTNNNKDRTEAILSEWVERMRGQYAAIEMDASDVAERVQDFGVHEWNATRFSVLAKIRTGSLMRTLEYGCDFYFSADVDNFIRPCTLRELVALNLPIVAPMLRSVDPRSPYLNCHVDVDGNGYYRDCDQYKAVFEQSVVGVFEVPVVHCTYLIHARCIPELAYADGTPRHEYVIFSDVARKTGIPQYYDNRQVYGYLTLKEEAEAAMTLIGPEISVARLSANKVDSNRTFSSTSDFITAA